MSGQSLRSDGSGRKDEAGQKDGSGQKARYVAATWDLALACKLVNRAARSAPPGLAERLQEEWLADLASRQGTFSRIRFGLGCCWATRVIAHEFGAAAAVAGESASGQRLLVGYGGYDFSRFSRRTAALIVIVGLHLAVFYAYLSGFTQRIVVEPAKWIDTTFITRTQRPPEQPRLPQPTLSPRIVDSVPPLDPTFKIPPDPTTITVPRSTQPLVPAVPLVPPQRVNRVIGGPGAGFPDTEDYYPPAARRLGEEGTSDVNVCVDPRGKLTAAPTLLDSSGIRLIDEGALRLATAGSGHYRPTTENGRPVSSCYAFRIRFQLEDQ